MSSIHVGPLTAPRRTGRAIISFLIVLSVLTGVWGGSFSAVPARAEDPSATPQVLLAPAEDAAPGTSRYVVPDAPTIPAAVPAAGVFVSPQAVSEADQEQPGSLGIAQLAYSRDGKTVALGTAFGVYLYDGRTGEPIGRIDTGGVVSHIVFSPDGALLAAGSTGTDVQIWEVSTGALARTLQAQGGEVRWLDFSPDGATLAVASSDAMIRLWNVANGQIIRTLSGHTGPVQSVAFSPSGRFLASGSDDGSLRVWTVETGVSTASVVGAPGGVTQVAYSPDGALLAFGSGDGPVGIWQVRTGKTVSTLTGLQGAATGLAFSPTASLLAVASLDGTVRLWPIGVAEPLAVLPGGQDLNLAAVSALAFRPDGNRLLTFSYSGEFRNWDVAGLPPAVACSDNAEFVADVTVPNNTVIAPGAPFQKVWRIRNSGTCPWTSGYRLVFVSGAQLGALPVVALTDVAPGATLDIAVDMIAPAPGAYEGIWELVNAADQTFGPGLNVVIQSGAAGPAVYINASATNINAGDSVIIQASALATVAAWLDGEAMVNGFAQKTVQLCGTTTFTVDGQLPDGTHIIQSVTVTVNGSCGDDDESDLVIKELKASNTHPAVGEEVHFSARIKNEGDAEARDFDLDWRPSSGSSYSEKKGDFDLDPDDDMWVNWNYTYGSAGTYQTRARIEDDDDDEVAHRSLTIYVGGATATPTATPGASDVIIASLTADDTTPAAGQTVHLNAVLHNQGAGPATGHRLVWKPSDGAPSLLIADNVSLAAGGSASFDFDYTWSQAGSYGTQAVLTPGGYARSLTIVVSSPFATPTLGAPTATPTAGPPAAGNPNLVISSFTADAGPYVINAEIKFTAVIENVGDGPANGFRLLWRESSSSPFQLQADGQSLAPGGVMTMVFGHTYVVPGTYETEELVEFSGVRGLAMSAAAASNSATLTVVVGAAKSSLTQGTVTATLAVAPTATSAPAATATPTPLKAEISPTETVMAATAEPVPTDTAVPATPAAPPTAEATAVPEASVVAPPPVPPTAEAIAVPEASVVAPPPVPPTAEPTAVPAAGEGGPPPIVPTQEPAAEIAVPPTATATLAATDTPARVKITAPQPTAQPTPGPMVTAIRTKAPASPQSRRGGNVRPTSQPPKSQPTVAPQPPKLQPPTPVYLVITMPAPTPTLVLAPEFEGSDGGG